MAAALLGLGSNEGDREGTLRAAIAEIEALPDVRVRRASEFYRTAPLGGPAGQGEFLNAAVVIETSTEPLMLLDELKDIEVRHGRDLTAERWSARPLDIDLLLYENVVMETAMLTVPHLRLAFRRFVLEPAVEVAPRMLHPVIGWPLERLLLHLDEASDQVAIVSPSEAVRKRFSRLLVDRFHAEVEEAPVFATVEQFWPGVATTWVRMVAADENRPKAKGGLPYAAAAFPKLTVMIDADSTSATVARPQWSVLVRRPGRGPTLRLQEIDAATHEAEVLAGVESVWPDLGGRQF